MTITQPPPTPTGQGDPTTASAPILDWQRDIATALVGADTASAAYVPDSRLNGILRAMTPGPVRLRSLTREEECVAYAAGQRMGNRRSVVMMQSSGLGNCVNALATLAVPYRLGIPLVISMRGTLGETNPSQIPIGRALRGILGSLGIQAFSLTDAACAATITTAVLDMAFGAGETAALLIEPELGGGRARS